MPKMLFRCLLILLFIFCVNAQQFPAVPCPNYFQYYVDGFHYYGKITIPASNKNIDLTVYFSQRQPIRNNYFGKITLENRNPFVYRVQFPARNEVPRLTKIVINGADICLQNPYPSPSTTFFLTHKLSTQQVQLTYPQIHSQRFPNDRNIFNQFPIHSTQQPGKKYPPLDSHKPDDGLFDVIEDTPVTQSPQCGIGNDVTPFIHGGHEIMPGEFPWLTTLYTKFAGLRFVCGGALISTRTVLTAGHCVRIGNLNANRIVVHLGRHNMEDFSEQEYVTRELQHLIVHPEYQGTVFPDADLALLFLKNPVEYKHNIRPICLWTETDDVDFIAGETAVVAGWGADEYGNTYTAAPKKADARIVTEAECLRNAPEYISLASTRTLCAGNLDDTGPCMGDSGSALMIKRNGRWYLRGLVSAGLVENHRCNLRKYSIFCDVAKHMPWVQSNLIP